ncbi:MAG: FAD-dependent thymidylate synthase [Bacilli bacterium]|nr:FAD-dependent thymidylate synthase [Bacilli bacterium]
MKLVMLGNNTKEEIEKRLQIVASAGALSRADGTVTQVFENRYNYEANLKLARAVVGYGHKSIAEHDYVVFAIEDVTPIIEQTLIGYRLTSFTIKSRRNVDFRNVGFYIPTFKDANGNILANNNKLQEEYITYMQSLFEKYGDWVDEEIPVEDCRYILPYSYHSNIIMGCDCNELLRITSDLLYGKLSHIDELKDLGEKFKKMIEDNAPYLTRALLKEENKEYYIEHFNYLDELVNNTNMITGELFDSVNMTNYTNDADLEVLYNIIMSRYQVRRECAIEILHQIELVAPNIKTEMIKSLFKSKNQRELEQVTFSFEFAISLAVLTHITRHRMHSLLVPEFVPMWNLENYIIPKTVAKNHEDEYHKIFANNALMVEHFKEQGVRDEDLIYFYLSGNACNVYTTMNARTLMWISRMRTCNKAQWEIRDIVGQMVEEANSVAPLIGSGLGPYCKSDGICPEGKDSCKKRGVVIKKKEK